MKIKSAIVFITAMLTAVMAYAADSPFLDLRSKISDESREVKSLMANSKDPILISSLWDSCLMTASQLDAYFAMLGIFNTIKKQDYTQEAIDQLYGWLTAIKKTNDLNVKSLDSVMETIDSDTRMHVVVIKNYFKQLSREIDSELNKLSLLKKTVKPRPKSK